MNHFLASMVSGLNAVIAVLIIIVFAGIGAAASDQAQASPLVGLILGGLSGLVVATLVCGLLALMIDIRNTLRELVELSRTTK